MDSTIKVGDIVSYNDIQMRVDGIGPIHGELYALCSYEGLFNSLVQDYFRVEDLCVTSS